MSNLSDQVVRRDHTNGSDQVCVPPPTHGQKPKRSISSDTLRMVSTAKNDHGNLPLTSNMCEVQIPQEERAQATSTSVQSPPTLTPDAQQDTDEVTRVALRAISVLQSRTPTSEDKLQPECLATLSYYHSGTSDDESSIDDPRSRRHSSNDTRAVAPCQYLEMTGDRDGAIPNSTYALEESTHDSRPDMKDLSGPRAAAADLPEGTHPRGSPRLHKSIKSHKNEKF